MIDIRAKPFMWQKWHRWITFQSHKNFNNFFLLAKRLTTVNNERKKEHESKECKQKESRSEWTSDKSVGDTHKNPWFQSSKHIWMAQRDPDQSKVLWHNMSFLINSINIGRIPNFTIFCLALNGTFTFTQFIDCSEIECKADKCVVCLTTIDSEGLELFASFRRKIHSHLLNEVAERETTLDQFARFQTNHGRFEREKDYLISILFSHQHNRFETQTNLFTFRGDRGIFVICTWYTECCVFSFWLDTHVGLANTQRVSFTRSISYGQRVESLKMYACWANRWLILKRYKLRDMPT